MQVNLGDPKRVNHPSEIENRLAYAQRIIVFMDKHIPRAKAANLAVLDHASWNRIATLAGEKHLPSKSTISTVIGMVHMRDEMVKRIQSFAGSDERLLSRLVSHDPDAELV